jgi:hypothetical protein
MPLRNHQDGGAGDGREDGVKDPEPGLRETHARQNVARDKWCCACRSWLPAEAFRANSQYNTGYDPWCKACHAKATREWRARNPEHLERYNADRRREYREAHPLPTRPCVVCGKSFSGRPDALVCRPECRQQRKLEQRRASRAA